MLGKEKIQDIVNQILLYLAQENQQHLNFIVSKHLNLFLVTQLKHLQFIQIRNFDDYNEIEKKLNIDVYFADYYYSSWQRGTNQNTNGLLIEFCPKKFNFSMITQDNK